MGQETQGTRPFILRSKAGQTGLSHKLSTTDAPTTYLADTTRSLSNISPCLSTDNPTYIP